MANQVNNSSCLPLNFVEHATTPDARASVQLVRSFVLLNPQQLCAVSKASLKELFNSFQFSSAKSSVYKCIESKLLSFLNYFFYFATSNDN